MRVRPSGERSQVEVLAVRAAVALGEEDAQAERAGAGLGELLDLAEADVDVELFALEGDGFGVGGAEGQRACDGVFGELPEGGGMRCGAAFAVVLNGMSSSAFASGPIAASLNPLGNRGSGEAGGAAVGGGVEAGADGAVLGVALQLVLDVRDGAGGVALVQLQRAVALLAAELGIAVEDGVGDGLDLPEGLIPAARTDAAAFHFALIELLGSDCNFGSHSLSFLVRLRCVCGSNPKGSKEVLH